MDTCALTEARSLNLGTLDLKVEVISGTFFTDAGSYRPGPGPFT